MSHLLYKIAPYQDPILEQSSKMRSLVTMCLWISKSVLKYVEMHRNVSVADQIFTTQKQRHETINHPLHQKTLYQDPIQSSKNEFF